MRGNGERHELDFDVIEEIRKVLLTSRKYSSFFEWNDKSIKEKGVAESLNDGIKARGENNFLDIRPLRNDPPDLIAKDSSGKIVGIEVTELVSEKAAGQYAKGKDVYWDWDKVEVVKEIEGIMLKKDSKTYRGAFDRIILVIFTAEFAICSKDFYEFLKGYTFTSLKQINEAYLLFRYDPGIRSYPYIRLTLGASVKA